MRKIFEALALSIVVILSPVGAQAMDPQPAELQVRDVAEIRNTILQQLEAFRADDADRAFSYAAPEIRRRFKTAEMFLTMVRKSYQAVYRPRFSELLPIQRIEGNIVQPLAVIGPSGILETAFYIMEPQPRGGWKIGACIIARKPGEDT